MIKEDKRKRRSMSAFFMETLVFVLVEKEIFL
jgi:hypothetical protein